MVRTLRATVATRLLRCKPGDGLGARPALLLGQGRPDGLAKGRIFLRRVRIGLM